MGWRDRPYSYDDQPSGQGSGLKWSLPPWTKWVRNLIIINMVVFILDALLRGNGPFIRATFGFRLHEATAGLQIWRWITYQFVHWDAWHLLMNLIGLYFFGPPLEKTFGPRRFVTFYLTCGAVGSLFFVLRIVLADAPEADRSLIGASGAVLGLITGAAILFPSILIFGLIPIRFVAVLCGLYYLFSAIDPDDAQRFSNACHLGGVLAAIIWIYYIRKGTGWLSRTQQKFNQGAWQRKLDLQQAERQEVDRILAKVHQHGIQNLTRREKKTLQQASDRQRRDERPPRRTDQL